MHISGSMPYFTNAYHIDSRSKIQSAYVLADFYPGEGKVSSLLLRTAERLSGWRSRRHRFARCLNYAKACGQTLAKAGAAGVRIRDSIGVTELYRCESSSASVESLSRRGISKFLKKNLMTLKSTLLSTWLKRRALTRSQRTNFELSRTRE